jgi:hypothetical protein
MGKLVEAGPPGERPDVVQPAESVAVTTHRVTPVASTSNCADLAEMDTAARASDRRFLPD